MKKFFQGVLSVVVIAGFTGAGAATYYRDRDRFIPGGVCMVDFYGSTINAALVQQVHHNEFSIRVGHYTFKNPIFGEFKDTSTYRTATLLRITLVNGKYYDKELPAEQAEPAKLAFLKQIEEKCK